MATDAVASSLAETKTSIAAGPRRAAIDVAAIGFRRTRVRPRFFLVRPDFAAFTFVSARNGQAR